MFGGTPLLLYCNTYIQSVAGLLLQYEIYGWTPLLTICNPSIYGWSTVLYLQYVYIQSVLTNYMQPVTPFIQFANWLDSFTFTYNINVEL